LVVAGKRFTGLDLRSAMLIIKKALGFKRSALGFRPKTLYLYLSTLKDGSEKNYDPYPSEYEGNRGTDFHDYGL
jgi:hypothetical protein